MIFSDTHRLIKIANKFEGLQIIYAGKAHPKDGAGKDVIKRVSMAKWWIAEMANRSASLCLDLFQDYGYLEDYKIGRFFRDVRAHPIYAGTNEIMKRIIAKVLGL
jgi:alkylation response protein AidB-like acyl-CoA dehydrogenase